MALAAQDRYSLAVPGGLAFAEFKGYEDWQVVSVSSQGEKLAAILGNPAMIEAYKAGIPGNGKPFPDGAKMAKIHWVAEEGRRPAGRADRAGRAARRRLHGEGQQEVCGQRRMGLRRSSNMTPRPRVQAGRHDQLAAAGARRQMRLCLPHDRGGQGLRVHRLSEAVRMRARLVSPACAPAVEAEEPVERDRARAEGHDRERHRRPGQMIVRPAVRIGELDDCGHAREARAPPSG